MPRSEKLFIPGFYGESYLTFFDFSNLDRLLVIKLFRIEPIIIVSVIEFNSSIWEAKLDLLTCSPRLLQNTVFADIKIYIIAGNNCFGNSLHKKGLVSTPEYIFLGMILHSSNSVTLD